jgi:hypothetical protein
VCYNEVEFSPYITCDWCDVKVPEACRAVRESTQKVDDTEIPETMAARLVQALSWGSNLHCTIWNAHGVLDAPILAEPNAAAELVLVRADGDGWLTFECQFGYLKVGRDGIPMEANVEEHREAEEEAHRELMKMLEAHKLELKARAQRQQG